MMLMTTVIMMVIIMIVAPTVIFIISCTPSSSSSCISISSCIIRRCMGSSPWFTTLAPTLAPCGTVARGAAGPDRSAPSWAHRSSAGRRSVTAAACLHCAPLCCSHSDKPYCELVRFYWTAVVSDTATLDMEAPRVQDRRRAPLLLLFPKVSPCPRLCANRLWML